MLKALSRAISQSFDPAFRRVFNRSLIYSLVTFVAVWLASWFALDWAGAGLVAWLRDWTGDGAWIAPIEWLVDAAAIGAIAVASFFLFPAVMASIMALLLEDIAKAVERRHYPELPPARAQPLGEAVLGGLIFALVTLILNLLVLPLYLILLFVPPLNFVLFYLLNGYLLGREYFQIMAIRRLGPRGARMLRRRHALTIWIAGVLMAVPLTIPLVNLLVPVLGAATFTHIFHGLVAKTPGLDAGLEADLVDQ